MTVIRLPSFYMEKILLQDGYATVYNPSLYQTGTEYANSVAQKLVVNEAHV